jgi:trans-aconitate methyltransferase
MNYGFDGEKYKTASTHQKEWGSKLIAELKLVGTERVLDLGSGDGALTAQIASLVPQGQAVGVDSSPSMIEVARRHAQPNLHFEMLDINALSYEAQFDVVFSNATLHWVKDHRRLLDHVFAALKPGGIVRFNFAADGNCATFNRMVQELMASDRYVSYFQEFEWPWYMPRLEEYQTLASRFAFRELKVWGENADRFFADAAAMTLWINQPSLVPFLPWVPESEREAFRGEVIDRMVRATRQPDGTCFELFRRINLYARK